MERAWACLGRVRGGRGGLGRGHLGGCLGHLGGRGCGHWFAYRKKEEIDGMLLLKVYGRERWCCCVYVVGL